MYVYDCNAILKTATNNISDKEMIWDFIEFTTDFKSCRINPGIHFMDNEASTDFKMATITMDIKYQLVTPSNHRSNNAKISIQKLKNYFITVLCSVDKYFHLQFWDRLLY